LLITSLLSEGWETHKKNSTDLRINRVLIQWSNQFLEEFSYMEPPGKFLKRTNYTTSLLVVNKAAIFTFIQSLLSGMVEPVIPL
jgi:hypothetical protein